MVRRKKSSKKTDSFIDPALLAIKTVPPEIITAEKVTEKITGKKLKYKQKNSTQIRAAIKNYQKAVSRDKRANTILKKHYKELLRLKKKFNLK